MVKSANTRVNAFVITSETMEQFEGSEYFFDMLYYHWKRRKDAGKPTSVGGVCSYFCEVDKANDGSSIEKFKKKYKGGRITDIKKTWSGKWEIRIQTKKKLHVSKD